MASKEKQKSTKNFNLKTQKNYCAYLHLLRIPAAPLCDIPTSAVRFY